MFTATTIHMTGPVITEHDTFDEARAAAETRSPEVDGGTLPNVPDEYVNSSTYEAGVFWFGNRFAVIDNPDATY